LPVLCEGPVPVPLLPQGHPQVAMGAGVLRGEPDRLLVLVICPRFLVQGLWGSGSCGFGGRAGGRAVRPPQPLRRHPPRAVPPPPRALRGRPALPPRRYPSSSTAASLRLANTSRASSSSRSRPLNDSTYAFSQGLPGSMYSVATPDRASQARTAAATNSGPLSLRKCAGAPRSRASRARAATTSAALR